MIDLKSVTLFDNVSLKEVIQKIDESSLQVALVIDRQGHLIGTVTDGDIRRGLLKGIGMQDPVSKIMNRHPIVGHSKIDSAAATAMMLQREIRHLPLVDSVGKLVGLEVLRTPVKYEKKLNPVVLMAGGFGKRLGALTSNTPKPLLPVKDRPILESIVRHVRGFGFQRLYISINYKGDQIKKYFGGGQNWDVQIDYLEEQNPLGTAGSLAFLNLKDDLPIVVMNGDLATNVNMDHLLDHHLRQNATATVCVRDYDIQIPYGVLRVDDHQSVQALEEKPNLKLLVNAGIYILSPGCLSLIPKNEYFDMTELLEKLLNSKAKVSAFHVRENWLDIGNVDEYERANRSES